MVDLLGEMVVYQRLPRENLRSLPRKTIGKEAFSPGKTLFLADFPWEGPQLTPGTADFPLQINGRTT
jgi:hypothetical protein